MGRVSAVVLDVCRLLKVLVVIDAEHRSIAGAESADLRLKVACRGMAHNGQDREAMEVRHADARVEPLIFELCHPIGKKIGVFSRSLKS